jgi:hypothetical protein
MRCQRFFLTLARIPQLPKACKMKAGVAKPLLKQSLEQGNLFICGENLRPK